MKCMSTMTVLAILAGACVAAEEVSAGTGRRPPAVGPGRPVDLAICLDTSGSMRGLIESAKQKLWAVVNELATAKPRPVLRVGLYHYGNSGLDSRTGWVLKLCDLTDDLDTVYSKLFALRTNGGTEYVARVVRAATNELDWNADKGTLRIIFVAGNEAATQDKEYKLQDICAAAAGKGIIVNTIFCGPDARGRSTGWADAARWADGQYASIDQNRGTLVISTPYDKELSDLGVRLNATYIGYGKGGAAGLANQARQDANAASMGRAAAAQRSSAKASGLYRATRWDLVDATKDKKVDLASLKPEELPEKMRKMTPEQRKEYIETKAKERAKTAARIRELTAKRDAHVKTEMARKGLSESQAFDAALRKAIRDQAKGKGFQFEKAPTPASAPSK